MLSTKNTGPSCGELLLPIKNQKRIVTGYIHPYVCRSKISSASGIRELEYHHRASVVALGQLRTVRRENRIREGSLFLSLPNFNAYASFPEHTMHTFYSIHVELLRTLLDEDYEDSFTISKSDLAALDTELLDLVMGIPADTGRKPRLLSKYGDWKASELKVFSVCLGTI